MFLWIFDKLKGKLVGNLPKMRGKKVPQRQMLTRSAPNPIIARV
jgi:hypothetical protein